MGDGDELMLGEVIGSYRVVRQLGKGGMGIVYLAEHVSIGNHAVVKTLLPEYAEDKEALARFFNEAKAATAIKHPGIVTIFDFGEHPTSKAAYIVMEYLDGESLAARITRGPIPWEEAATIARHTASVLGAAHRAGIVHRDLKPDNLFLVPDPDMPSAERVKVLDFGIAKLATAGTALTLGESAMGTPAYMAPEQCRNAAGVDARADIYALGCILYEMLTGAPPFAGSIAQLVTNHLYTAPVAPSELVAGLPPVLEHAVLRALAKTPDERHPDMASLARELDGVLGRSIATPPLGAPVVSVSTPPSGVPITTSEPSAPAPSAAAPVVSTVTTLGGSARFTETAPAPRRQVAAILVGVAAMAIAGIASFVLLRREPSGSTSAPAEIATPTPATVAELRPPATTPPPPPTRSPPVVEATPTPPTSPRPVIEATPTPPPPIASTPPASPPPNRPPDPPARSAGSAEVAPGRLAITSKPPTGISIDGRDTGLRTPQAEIELAPGPHRITLTEPNARIAETFRVTIRTGRVESVHKDFTRRGVPPPRDPGRTTVNPFERTTIDPFKREPRR